MLMSLSREDVLDSVVATVAAAAVVGRCDKATTAKVIDLTNELIR